MRFLILILILIPLLAGCTLFEGMGGDSSKLSVQQRCEVTLKQAARVSGMDDADVVEDVKVNPDCTTTIKFRQVTGDTVSVIEEEGGTQVLETGRPAEAPTVTTGDQ